jgi:glutaminase
LKILLFILVILILDKLIMDLKQIITDIYNDLKSNNEGKVADYIPQLAKVNPELFGVSVCFPDGKIIDIGDTNEEFCIQSCSKPLSYCLARQLDKKNIVHNHVGYEPSGREFNAHVLNRENLPHNPVINAGAIMISSLIKPDSEPSERFETMQHFYQKMCGNVGKINYDNCVYLSEKQHGYRNISLSYYMLENNAFPTYVTSENIKNHLNLYFQCCSIQINTHIGAAITGTLSNNGVCPITSNRIIDTHIVRDCLSVMYMCGMYDYSGQFAFEVGLPAKSGVSGCIFLVIPNEMGICIWSPKLDELGNSVRGVLFCKEFIKRTKYKYHIFHNIVSNNKKISMTNENLISAAANGKLDQVKLLSKELGVNGTDYDKRTPLHLASAEGHVNVVKYLLDQNADPDAHDRYGSTPIHDAKLHLKDSLEIDSESEISKNYKKIILLLNGKKNSEVDINVSE